MLSIMKCIVLALVLAVLAVTAHPITSTHHHLTARQIRRRASGRECKSRPSTTESVETPTGTAVFVSVSAPASSRTPTPPAPTGEEEEEEEPTSTKTSTRTRESTKAPQPTSGAGVNALFPLGRPSGSSWTTAQSLGNALSLSDATLRPTNVMRSLPHPFVDMAGKRAMKAHFPKGSYTFAHQPQGGLSFYAPGPANVDLSEAREATLGYSVYFPAGFNFQKGGKLPGLYGGDSASEAIGCGGGRRSDACFSARLMFRTGGAGEFYTYLPPYTTPAFAANKKQCTAAPNSHCNPTYGASIGRDVFEFATGGWTTVSERVRLNDVGKANGELELFVNGKSVINVKGLILRARSAGKIRGIMMQTFFGGSNPSFASPKNQDLYFADFSVAITERL